MICWCSVDSRQGAPLAPLPGHSQYNTPRLANCTGSRALVPAVLPLRQFSYRIICTPYSRDPVNAGIENLQFKPAYNPYTEPSMEVFSYHEGLDKVVEIGNSGAYMACPAAPPPVPLPAALRHYHYTRGRRWLTCVSLLFAPRQAYSGPRCCSPWACPRTSSSSHGAFRWSGMWQLRTVAPSPFPSFYLARHASC